MTTRRAPRPWGTVVATVAAVAACAVCCAGPLIALLGGVGAVSALAAVWLPALGVVAAAALVGAYVLHRKRRTARDRTAQPVDLGLPGLSTDAGHRG